MDRLYAIGRIIEIREGCIERDNTRPVTYKLSMEANPYAPRLTAEITLGQQAREAWADAKVGQHVRIDFRAVTEKEWDSFNTFTFRVVESTPQAVRA